MGFWHFLGEPAWQGVGALIALVALVLAFWVERRRHARKVNGPAQQTALANDFPVAASGSLQDKAIKYFSITDEESERLFYEEFMSRIRNAKEIIYRMGRGFYHEQKSYWYKQIMQAEEAALIKDVTIRRIQIGGPVAAGWAKGYADLMKRYPKNFYMVMDLDNASLNDICLIDPHGHHPVVSFFFETRDTEHLGLSGRPVRVGRPVFAIFIHNERTLAKTLADQLVHQAENLPNLRPDDIRSLTLTYVYFAWGVHIARQKMQLDVPGAHFLSKARLHGWKRDIHHVVSGPAVQGTIHETGEDADHFDGVAYELSWWDKERLDQLERRAYKQTEVYVEIGGIRTKAFTYVPLPPGSNETTKSPGSWIYYVVEGAQQNEMDELLGELRSVGISPEEWSKGNIG
jgi:hypothetical protein